MIPRKTALCAMVLLLLSGGCQNSGEYYSETPHASSEEQTAGREFGSTASNYYDLQSAVLSMISAGRQVDTIRVQDYDGSLEEDLDRITREITTENPMGCFAVESLQFDQSQVLSYRELGITIQFKRQPQEIAAVRETPTREELEHRLTDLLSGSGTQGLYSVTNLEDSPDDLYDRVMKCWYSMAEHAYGLASVNISSYPAQGEKRIVEVNLTWTENRDVLEAQSQVAQEKAQQICQGFQGSTTYEKLKFVEDYLHQQVQYDDQAMKAVIETGGRQPRTNTYTAYGALAEERAAQSGLAHAAKLLLDQLDMTSALIAGTNGGVSYVWLRVQADGVWYQYDPLGSGPRGTAGLMSDEQAKQQGYEYNSNVYNLA